MNNNDKVFICNYWWFQSNYGAILTAYAINNLIENSILVNDINIKFHELYNLRYTFSFPFRKKYLKTIKLNDKYISLVELNKKANTFVVGSDQVFRIGTNFKERRYQYLLDFAYLKTKKIAFSASFGLDKKGVIEEAGKEAILWTKISLKSFDFISVREKSGVEICRDLFDVKAEWIIDPVFILDKSKWDELIENAELLKPVQNDNIKQSLQITHRSA